MEDPDCSVVEQVGQFLLDVVGNKHLYGDANIEDMDIMSIPDEETADTQAAAEDLINQNGLASSDPIIDLLSDSQDDVEVVFERLQPPKPLDFISLIDDSADFTPTVVVPKKKKKRKAVATPTTPKVKIGKGGRLRYFSTAELNSTGVAAGRIGKKAKLQKIRELQRLEKLKAIGMPFSTATHSLINQTAADIPTTSTPKTRLTRRKRKTSKSSVGKFSIPVAKEPRLLAIAKKKVKTSAKTPKKRKSAAPVDDDVTFISLNDTHQPPHTGPVPLHSVVVPIPQAQVRLLRPIVIDGPNVAMSHGNAQTFSCRGVWLCAEHWHKLGHQVHVVMPSILHKTATSRKVPVTESHLIDQLEQRGLIVRAPARKIVLQGGATKNIHPYDDRLIVQIAHVSGGVIISNDHYKDIMVEHPEYRDTLENRIIMYTWLMDVIFFPTDPLGRHGPHLEEVIRFPLGTNAPSLVCNMVPRVPTPTPLLQSVSGVITTWNK